MTELHSNLNSNPVINIIPNDENKKIAINRYCIQNGGQNQDKYNFTGPHG